MHILFDLFRRWRDRLAERASARAKFEAVLYFRGPLTTWAGKVHESDVLLRRRFVLRGFAEGWARTRLRDLQNVDFTIDELVE
jgi:hypothetical protein